MFSIAFDALRTSLRYVNMACAVDIVPVLPHRLRANSTAAYVVLCKSLDYRHARAPAFVACACNAIKANAAVRAHGEAYFESLLKEVPKDACTDALFPTADGMRWAYRTMAPPREVLDVDCVNLGKCGPMVEPLADGCGDLLVRSCRGQINGLVAHKTVCIRNCDLEGFIFFAQTHAVHL